MKRIKKISELLHFEVIDDGMVRFYLLNPDTNKGFAFDCVREDKPKLEEIFKRNGVEYEVDDGVGLPF